MTSMILKLLKISFILITILALFSVSVYAKEAPEEQIKGAMMVNFVKFVEWPVTLIEKTKGIITVGIIGDDSFFEAVNRMNNRVVSGKKIQIKRFKTLNGLSDCQVLFISATESCRTEAILRAVSGISVLTIGESEDFTRLGGIIRFFKENNRIRFEINKAQALKSNLKLSAKLLEISRLVQLTRYWAKFKKEVNQLKAKISAPWHSSVPSSYPILFSSHLWFNL